MFHKVLVANRGEIALRVFRTLKEMGLSSVAVYSEIDRMAPHVRAADEAVCLGSSPLTESYLSIEKILAAAHRVQADAIHPGYGFLAENAEFANRCSKENIVFIGPSANAIRLMGSKIQARALMNQHQIPIIAGYNGEEQSPEILKEEALKIKGAVLIKASAGGGGKGMRICRTPEEIEPAIAAAKREAMKAFGDDTLFLERYLESPRHIEIQILGDQKGNVVSLFERECSIQRRHQKIIEEAPSPALTKKLRDLMGEKAVAAAKAVEYYGAGTVEFLLDESGEFFFLEMNTRIQVEHPVTEKITGVDLVREQIRVAQGETLDSLPELKIQGHAIEFRLYAEEPENDFLPTTGTLHDYFFPSLNDVRVDTGVEKGSEVGIFYDPMLAKMIAYGENRFAAIRKMEQILRYTSLYGCGTNLGFLRKIVQHPEFVAGKMNTHFIEQHFPKGLREFPLPKEQLKIYFAAATFFRFLQRKEKSQILPQIPIGYRNNRFRNTEERFRFQEEEYEILYQVQENQRCDFTFGTENFSATLIEKKEEVIRFEIDGIQKDFRIVENQTEIYLHSVAGAVIFEVLPRFPETENEKVDDTFTAPMPGKIIKVLVQVGEMVEQGAILLLMEAMKMEHSILAPEKGVVKELFFQEGELVDRGVRLLEFEPQ